MVVCACKCLNVLLESDKVDNNVDNKKMEIATTEQRDNFFSEKLMSCPLNSLKTEVIHPALVKQQTVGHWSVQTCLVCATTTHAVKDISPNIVLISMSLLTTYDLINNLKKKSNFSTVFNLLVPEATVDIQMKENVDTNNVFNSNNKLWINTQQAVGNLSKQLNQKLQSELESVEETIRQYRDQKYAEFEAFREKAHRDHKTLICMVSRARSNSNDSYRVDASVDNDGPPSPHLPPIQRRRLSSLKDAKKYTQNIAKSKRIIPHHDDSLEAEDIFDLEGMDSQNNMMSDLDYDSSDDGNDDEGIHISRRRCDSTADIARSLPVNMPRLSTCPDQTPRVRDLDDYEETEDIAASIKALARSVHGDAFELPRPRFSTQI